MIDRSKHDPGFRPKSPTYPNDSPVSTEESEHAGTVLFWWFIGFIVLIYLFNL